MRIQSEALLKYSWIATKSVCNCNNAVVSRKPNDFMTKKNYNNIHNVGSFYIGKRMSSNRNVWPSNETPFFFFFKKSSVPSARSSASCTVADFSACQYNMS